ncbi:MAG: alpha-glucosidase [Oscillospiraceae bacterium]|nr:alpha-glucosidase [Oscillospiraceae bacterium]
MEQPDFRSMSFYQIWIRSFCDGNGDGIGDLYGVYDKLDYIKSLGVDAVWFSPIYPSPNADYGYDVSDYENVHPDYGDLEQFRRVLDRAHALGLKVILDLVINHTSDEHPWFLESRRGGEGPYRDYYFWRDPRKGKKGKRPNNWTSQFTGPAWEYDEGRGQYYLHLFAKKQPDLNMDNPKVREEIKSVMRFWLDMGVDGFREDVITFISKHEKLPNGIPWLPVINGMPYYKDGPNLLRYLREFRAVAQEYGAIQIGEAPMTGVKEALRYVAGEDRVLDMVIQFDHMTADCFYTEFLHHPFSLRKLKRAFSRWQYGLAGKAWNALYLENHDHPRVVSRYGSERYLRQSATALAAAYLFQQGCPFIYQGQELGMTNVRLPSIEEYLDVASHNLYRMFRHVSPEEKRLLRVQRSSRDSARTPMQWTKGPNAGFSRGKPWFAVNENYREINAEAEEADPDSVLNFYRRALALRKGNEALLRGEYREYEPQSRTLYMYERRGETQRILVVCSFSDRAQTYSLPPDYPAEAGELLLGNCPAGGRAGSLLPWEAQVLRWR